MVTYRCNQLISGKPGTFLETILRKCRAIPREVEILSHIFTARKNQFITVSDRQMEILAGGLLGDAYISKRGAIQIEQGANQKEYLFWKHKELKSIVSGKISRVFRKKKSGATFSSYRFFSKQYFRPWRQVMYRSGRKIIPASVLELITPLSLAVWYMDDGSKKNNYSVIISTDGFSKDSLKKLRTMLQEKWSINTRVVFKTTAGKKYGRLTIGSYDLVRFFELIRPYIIPSMKYKISDPVTTQSIKRRERLYLN